MTCLKKMLLCNSNFRKRFVMFGKKDTRPYWEVMADDGMNKFLKFCIFCIFAYGGFEVIVALVDRFSS